MWRLEQAIEQRCQYCGIAQGGAVEGKQRFSRERGQYDPGRDGRQRRLGGGRWGAGCEAIDDAQAGEVMVTLPEPVVAQAINELIFEAGQPAFVQSIFDSGGKQCIPAAIGVMISLTIDLAPPVERADSAIEGKRIEHGIGYFGGEIGALHGSVYVTGPVFSLGLAKPGVAALERKPLIDFHTAKHATAKGITLAAGGP
ncbi:hypothetical protein ATO46_06875 [Aeromonas schubertii]|nr:hypothetical protein ATO46_06875 [Aeromonas schubertii]